MSGEMTFSADIIVMNQPEPVSEEGTSKRLDDGVMDEIKMLQALTANGSNAPATSKQEPGRSSNRRASLIPEASQSEIGRDIEQSTYERIAEERRKRISDWLEKSGANEPIHTEEPAPSHRPTDKQYSRRHSEAASVGQVTKSIVTQTSTSTTFSARKTIARRLSDPMINFLGSFHHASKSSGVTKMLSFFQKEKPFAPYICGELTGLMPHLEDMFHQILMDSSPASAECHMQPEDFTACKKVCFHSSLCVCLPSRESALCKQHCTALHSRMYVCICVCALPLRQAACHLSRFCKQDSEFAVCACVEATGRLSCCAFHASRTTKAQDTMMRRQ